MSQPVDGILQEHEAIRGHMKTVSRTMGEWQTSLAGKEPAGSPADKRDAIARQQHFIRAMAYLRDGLKQHHSREEYVMLPFVGRPLMDALKLEHREMLHDLDKIDDHLMRTDPDGLIVNVDLLVDSISSLCELINAHSRKEDVMLELLNKLDSVK